MTTAAIRVLPLQGGRNFRDLGGYPTADGRTVRWGRLYRSGSMSGLTEADYQYLAGLGVRVICDFRSREERAAEPTVWPGANPPALYARDHDNPLNPMFAVIGGEPTAASNREGMLRLYKSLPYDHAPSYSRMFNELADGNVPLAFNCTAGKDRTGVAAALVLTVLGVPREQVLADYLLTDQVLDLEAVITRASAGKPLGELSRLALQTPEVRAPIMRADRAYLDATFDALIRQEGSVADFVRNRLGVTPAAVQAIRDRLLEAG